MIIMNDDDENDNNERTTHPLASEIQGQPCQALKSTKGPRVCVCVCVYVFVSVWPSGCHCATDFTSKRCLFIYLCIQLFTFFSALATCPCLQQKAAALCGHFTVRWSGFVSVLRLCVSVGEGDVKGPWPRLRF